MDIVNLRRSAPATVWSHHYDFILAAEESELLSGLATVLIARG